MDRAGLRAWVELYERAWRTAGTDLLAELFAPEATHQTAPFEPPFRGRPAIAAMWEAGRDGPGEIFSMGSEVVAVEGDIGVARVEVRYGDPGRQLYRDLWVVRCDAAGRCVAFEEWPFWPKGTQGGWHEGPKPADT
jgi:SnoaL-like domain